MGAILQLLKKHVATAKREQGLTQQRLADKMGYTAAHISQVLKGKTSLSEELIDRFCDALDLDLAELIGAPGPSYPNPEHDALHRRLQHLLNRGFSKPVERSITAIELTISKMEEK